MKNEKEVFIIRETYQIKAYKQFIEILNNLVIPTFNKYDGKLLTKRLLTEVMRKIKENSIEGVAVALKAHSLELIMLTDKRNRFVFSDGTSGGYISVDRIDFKIHLGGHMGVAVDADKTKIEIHRVINNLYVRCDKLQECILNYDKYESKTAMILSLIEKYKAEVPHYLRKVITVEK